MRSYARSPSLGALDAKDDPETIEGVASGVGGNGYGPICELKGSKLEDWDCESPSPGLAGVLKGWLLFLSRPLPLDEVAMLCWSSSLSGAGTVLGRRINTLARQYSAATELAKSERCFRVKLGVSSGNCDIQKFTMSSYIDKIDGDDSSWRNRKEDLIVVKSYVGSRVVSWES